MKFQSADFSTISINTLMSDTASITILAKKKPLSNNAANTAGRQQEESRIQKTNINDILASHVELNNNSVVYINESDSITAKATVNLNGKTIVYQNNENLPLNFKELNLAMRDLHFDQKRIRASTPSFDAKFTDGKLILADDKLYKAMRSGIDMNCESLDFVMDFKDSAAFSVKNLSGTFMTPGFEFSHRKIDWAPLQNLQHLTTGIASFENRDLKARQQISAGTVQKSIFATGYFSVKPKITATTAHKKDSGKEMSW